jgi:hypothetical protein
MCRCEPPNEVAGEQLFYGVYTMTLVNFAEHMADAPYDLRQSLSKHDETKISRKPTLGGSHRYSSEQPLFNESIWYFCYVLS